MLILKKFSEGYNFLFEEMSDHRSSTWPLLNSVFPIVIILTAYVYFVLKLGPELMSNRKPFKLKSFMIVYNVVQIILNLYVFLMGFKLGWVTRYKWFCEPVDFSNTEEGLFGPRICYIYFLIKILDLMDTIFFVLRKNARQVTFLHVYHHVGMVILTWFCCKLVPGGHGTFLGFVNSFVHCVMYFYYLICLVDDTYKASIWWKKHLTQLQIIQFVLLTLHFASLLVVTDCGYPRWVAGFLVPQNLFMGWMFVDFYVKTYMGGDKTHNKTNGRVTDDKNHKMNGHKSH